MLINNKESAKETLKEIMACYQLRFGCGDCDYCDKYKFALCSIYGRSVQVLRIISKKKRKHNI